MKLVLGILSFVFFNDFAFLHLKSKSFGFVASFYSFYLRAVAAACLVRTSALPVTGIDPGWLCWAAASSLEFLLVRLWAVVVADGVGLPVDVAGVPASAGPAHTTGTPGEFWSPAGQ